MDPQTTRLAYCHNKKTHQPRPIEIDSLQEAVGTLEALRAQLSKGHKCRPSSSPIIQEYHYPEASQELAHDWGFTEHRMPAAPNIKKWIGE